MSTQPDVELMAALLDALGPLGGVSGHEGAVLGFMAGELAAVSSKVWSDPVGNVIARFGDENARRKIAILAHMDTIGFMVKRVNEDKTLSVLPIGGVNLKSLPGTAVRVWSSPPPPGLPSLPGIPGMIGVRSQHLARPGDETVRLEDLYVQVDPGMADQISITTPITYAPQTLRLGNRLYCAPYLDNRAGCAVLLAVGQWLGRMSVSRPWTVYLVGTVQEETTCAGALSALRAIAPDTAVFIDGTLSYDTPETHHDGSVRLGGGPVLTAHLYVSGLNGWHADAGLRVHLKATALEQNIPVQEDAVRGLMSDARAATWLGIRSALIGLPMRGKHAPLETVHLDDLVHAARLIMVELGSPYDLP